MTMFAKCYNIHFVAALLNSHKCVPDQTRPDQRRSIAVIITLSNEGNTNSIAMKQKRFILSSLVNFNETNNHDHDNEKTPEVAST